jgi:sugar/nucleoside kinase (ribokinase family)
VGPDYDLVAVGDVMLDVHLPALEGARLHAPIAVRVGGSAVNAARAAAQRGQRAVVVGRVGDDPAGRLIASELVRQGMDALLEVDPELPTGTTAYVGDSVVADRGANVRLDAPELPEGRATLVSGYLPSPGPILDRASGLRGFDTQGVEAPLEADVLIGPDLELTGAPVVCATQGRDGATATAGGETVSVRPERVLDEAPVGAGDAFAAVFLLALADGAPLETALRDGCSAAAGAAH